LSLSARFIRLPPKQCHTIWKGDIFRHTVRLSPLSLIILGFSVVSTLKICVSYGGLNILQPPPIIPSFLGGTGKWESEIRITDFSSRISELVGRGTVVSECDFNTAVHERTRSTPDKLFWGTEMKCHLGVRWDLSSVNNGDFDGRNQSFWTRAYHNLQVAGKRVARRYNQNDTPHQYCVGDTVRYQLKLCTSKAQNISAKLLLMWSEPMILAQRVRPNVVLLANPDACVIIRRAHVSQLKPCAK